MKQTRYPSLTKKAVIKQFFTSNKQVLTSLLQEFFSVTDEVLDVAVVDTGREAAYARLRQTSDPEDLPDIHRIVLDLLVKLSSGKKIGVQLQVAINEEKDFVDCIISDWGFLYDYGLEQTRLAGRIEAYPTHSLIFTHFTVREKEQNYIHRAKMTFDDDPDRDVWPNFKITLVELNKFNKGCSELINMQDRWNYIMKQSADLTAKQVEHLSQDEDARMVLEHLEGISKDGSLN